VISSRIYLYTVVIMTCISVCPA